MAVVLTSLLTTVTRTVFLKPPDLVRMFSPIPRALLNFDILNGTLDAKPSTDTQELVLSIVLPGTFAYRMIEASVSLVQDVAKDWNNMTWMEFTNAIRNLPGGSTQRHAMIKSSGTLTPGGSEQWMLAAEQDVPKYVIQAVSQVATPVITYKANNDTSAAGAAGTVNCHFAFLEYDIEQAETFFLHYPILTLER